MVVRWLGGQIDRVNASVHGDEWIVLSADWGFAMGVREAEEGFEEEGGGHEEEEGAPDFGGEGAACR